MAIITSIRITTEKQNKLAVSYNPTAFYAILDVRSDSTEYDYVAVCAMETHNVRDALTLAVSLFWKNIVTTMEHTNGQQLYVRVLWSPEKVVYDALRIAKNKRW